MREIPKEITSYQKKKRQETIYKVQQAIDELREEGAIINRKSILDRCQLSNSVLSKPHIIELLKENKVCQFEVKCKIENNEDENIVKELNKANKRIEILEKQLEDLKNKFNKEKLNNYELKEANEILRGELQLLVSKAKMKGINLKE